MKNIFTTFLTITFSILIALPSFSQAQGDWCGTDERWEEAVKNNPALKQKMQELIQKAKKAGPSQKTLYTIPVVVHVFSDKNWTGNITKGQVEDGIRVLNEDFRRINSDTSNTRSIFKPYAADAEFQFKLAKIDPNGNCTEGIVRVQTELTHEADNQIKSVSRWPTNEYLNIWLVNNISTGGGGTTLGYAEFPYGGLTNTWGAVIRHDQFGTIETAASADGRTTTHEVGHTLGLLHTFQGGCSGSCDNSGDYACDTPPASNATFSCGSTINTCGTSSGPTPYSSNVPDQIENFMSYNSCQNMFSLDQKAIMQGNITNIGGLTNLTSSSNLTATGTNSGYTPQLCEPIAEFKREIGKEMICTGDSVLYSDLSWNGKVSTWNWTFQGGTPSTSSDSSEYVTYNSAGEFDASLAVSNASGSDTKTQTDLVLVSSQTAMYSSAFYDDLESSTQFDNDYIILNPEGSQKWTHYGSAGYSGSSSAMVFNYANTNGHKEQLISPSFDLSQINSPDLMFRCAFAQKNSNSDDLLKVYVSVDCGQSWGLRYVKKAGSGLESGPITSNSYKPSSSAEWKLHTVDLSGYASRTNVRVMFELINGGGNNLYLDDINIKNYTGIDENAGITSNYNIFPNPSNGNATISFNLAENANVDLSVIDLVGKKVLGVFNGSELQRGEHKVQLNEEVNLSKGVYFVRLQVGDEEMTKKVVIQ